MEFKSGRELLELCRRTGLPISELMRRREIELVETTREAVDRRMARVLEIMRESASLPLRKPPNPPAASSAGSPGSSMTTPPGERPSAGRSSSWPWPTTWGCPR